MKGFLAIVAEVSRLQRAFGELCTSAPPRMHVLSQAEGCASQSAILQFSAQTSVEPWTLSPVAFRPVMISGRVFFDGAGTSDQNGAGPSEQLVWATVRRSGAAGFNALNGEFATLVVDEPGHLIFAAVDLFGIRSLYYYVEDGLLMVSDCCSALLAVLGDRVRMDRAVIAASLVPLGEGCADLGLTFYKQVRTLRAGESLRCDLRDLKTTLVPRAFPGSVIDPSSVGRKQIFGNFRSAFTQAVHDRLIGESRVAIGLSGGIDSAAIALVLSELRIAGPEFEIAAGTSVLESDQEELRCAELTATALKLDLHRLYRNVAALKHPLASPVPYSESPLSLYADLSQLRTLDALGQPLFIGLGADEIMNAVMRRPKVRRTPVMRMKRAVFRLIRRLRRLRSGDGDPRMDSEDRDLAELICKGSLNWIAPRWRADLPPIASGHGEGARPDWREQLSGPGGFRSDVEAVDRGGIFRPRVTLPFLDQRVVSALLDPAVSEFELDNLPGTPTKQFLRRFLSCRLPRQVWARPKAPAGNFVFRNLPRSPETNGDHLVRTVPGLGEFISAENLPEPNVDRPWSTIYPHLATMSLAAWLYHSNGVGKRWKINV